jgi:hypothetical protein
MLRREAARITQAWPSAKTVLTSLAAFDMTFHMTDSSSPKRKPARSKASKTREQRLAEALRANLRRRKAPRGTPETDEPAAEKPQDES